jgi:hypothetical protein
MSRIKKLMWPAAKLGARPPVSVLAKRIAYYFNNYYIATSKSLGRVVMPRGFHPAS